MTVQSSTQTWEVELLTPLHIGDGTELLNNQDYIVQHKSVDVYDLETIIESLSDTPRAIDDLAKQIKLDQIFKDYRVSIQPYYSLPLRGNSTPQKGFRRFLKNAYGQPFIPGSSLKGAIHTALWTTLDRSRLPDVNRFHDFSQGVKQLGGKDPYCMFIRPLQISDTIDVEAQGNLACEEIKFFNLKHNNQPGWKDFVSKQNKDRHNEANGVFVECLKPGVKFTLQTKLDPFLLSHSIQQSAKLVQCESLSGFRKLFATVNRHSRHIAQREIDFFSPYKSQTSDVISFYESLIQGIDHVSSKSEAFIIRLSWGSGWRGMTGDWLTNQQLEQVRTVKRLGKHGFSVFPKTRRLAMKPVKNIPSIPLGWALVQPVTKKRFSK